MNKTRGSTLPTLIEESTGIPIQILKIREINKRDSNKEAEVKLTLFDMILCPKDSKIEPKKLLRLINTFSKVARYARSGGGVGEEWGGGPHNVCTCK
jgi:hypothetical protein